MAASNSANALNHPPFDFCWVNLWAVRFALKLPKSGGLQSQFAPLANHLA